MLKAFTDWLEARTGYRALVHEALEEPIPGGARWRYVFGSALTSVFLIQVATGIFLMFSYSPSSSTAWGSVYFISHEMDGGWFLRGIHHFGSQAMIVLLALHLLQVLWAGAYRAPREVNWWFGMALMFVTLGFSLTGYLLPWDQKGFWATKVATNIMGGAPVVGPYVQKVVVGGPDYGNQTLTRFYGLHVGVFPALMVMCLAAHVALFRKHGVTPPRDAEKKPTGTFWPEQVFLDAVFSAAVFGVMVLLVVSEHGANLDAPADPASSDYPARPEWYFLSLFQMLKLFPGDREIIGTIVIPTAILVVMMLLPLFDRVLPSKLAHFLACAFVFGLIGGAGFLTYSAWKADSEDPVYLASREKADVARARALRLAGDPAVGVPPDGASYVLLRDPLHHGRAVLDAKCLGCHAYEGKSIGDQVAPDLKGFATREWVRGLLENPRSDRYFGKVPQCDGMAEWKKGSKLSPKQLDDVADFVATFAKIPPDLTAEEWLNQDAVANHPGLTPFQEDCGECHVVEGLSEGGTRDAPRLFGYSSPRWVSRMIHRPGAPDMYGYLEPKDQMPSFSDQLTTNDVETVVRYILGDYPAESSPAPAPR